jgi:hypothetical protein
MRNSPDEAAHYHNLNGRTMVQFVTDFPPPWLWFDPRSGLGKFVVNKIFLV